MENIDALLPVAMQFGLQLNDKDYVAARLLLATKINELVLKDFDRLLGILYRIDVSEKRITDLLKAFPKQDAGLLIADLMIEREVEKIKSREIFTNRDQDFDEEEKW